MEGFGTRLTEFKPMGQVHSHSRVCSRLWRSLKEAIQASGEEGSSGGRGERAGGPRWLGTLPTGTLWTQVS